MRNIFLLLSLFNFFYSSSQVITQHLEVGDKAPEIFGKDQFDKEINSSVLLEKNKIILIFYRGFWCPYCRKHLKSLQDNLEALTEKGYYVLVVSPEKVEKTKETSEKLKASFSILHDIDNKIMDSYKVTFDVTKENVPSYFRFTKNKVGEYNEENNDVLPVPATYIIGKDGNICLVHFNPDYTKRFNITELLDE